MNENKKTVLVVDDDKSTLEVMEQFIKFIADDVIVTPDANKALEVLKNRCIDLVITDYSMYEMDGVTFTKIVKKEYPDTPLVMISAVYGIEQTALSAGVDSFIKKPLYDLREFKESIENLWRK